MNIGTWPGSRIIWLSIAWIIIAGGVSAIISQHALRGLPPDDSGLAGISINPAGLTVLLAPPVSLVLIWVVQRKRLSSGGIRASR